MREIIDQWEVDTKRSSLRLLCFPGIPDRTRHRTSSRYYLHQPPARPFVSLYSRPHFEYTIRREFSACHSMITRPERCKAYVFIYILLFRNVHSVDIPVYTYLSFTLSRATKRNNVMKQETYIHIYIIYNIYTYLFQPTTFIR